MNFWLNLIAFQVLWFAIIGGVAQGLEWLGPALLLAWLPAQMWLSEHAMADLRLFLALGALGPLLDSTLVQAGFIRFTGTALLDGLAPWWMAALWANFALTLNHSMRWIRRHPPVAGLFGAIGGPLAYLAGVRLGAAEFLTPPAIALSALAVAWGAVLLLLAWLPGPSRSAPVLP